MKVKWMLSATNDLKKIYKFYKKNASVEVAQKILDEIFTTTDTLQLGIYLGQEEELLKHCGQGHRYLISNHSKIIYLPCQDHVKITHVFDTRDNPNKIST